VIAENLLLWGIASWAVTLLSVALLLIAIFLILLVLIQRGKGGGLAGAFGGAGGSSAFGTRAGDTFTRITIVVAAVWLLLIMIVIKTTQPQLTGDSDKTAFSSGTPEPVDSGQ
jgi:preprotein translocase subunit SecG